MKFKPSSLAAFSIVCAGLSCAHAAPIAPLSSPAFQDYPTSKAPYAGVFRWSALNPSGGAQGNAAYAQWLNRPVVWAVDYTGSNTWDDVQGANWMLSHWSNWKKEVPGRRFIVTVGILAGPKDLSGPTTGLGAGQPVSLAMGATGKYNAYFQKLAYNLVRLNLGDSVVRLGWEFDGNWFTWSARNDPTNFAAYWRQIVTTMRAVPGAEKLQFCWNCGAGSDAKFKPESAWPGDDYVDIIGLDVYDQSWVSGTYPLPADATAADKDARRQKAWDVTLNGDHGLNWWKEFGAQHHKPLSFPEWGSDNRKDNHDGDDNVLYIEGMHKFITDPTTNVYFQSYFDVQAGDGHHQLSPGIDGKFVTEFPLAAARFKELFSLRPAAAAPRNVESFRYSLAIQQEFGRKLGFSLGFENNAPDIPRQFETLKLVLAVSDGKSWRFPTYTPQWQWNHEYQVKAIYGPQQSELWVDGQRVLQSAGGFMPSDALHEVRAGLESRNMDGTTDFRVQQTSLHVSTDKGQTVAGTFPKPANQPVAVFLFDPQTPVHLPWNTVQGDTVTVETSFRLIHGDAQTVEAMAPFVDRFGQSRHANWSGKVLSEADLQQATADEKRRQAAFGMPPGYDRYGGSTRAGWSEKPTGFFHTTRRNGFWWLVSPDGNPTFYVGVDTVDGTSEATPVAGRETYFDQLPPQQGEFAPAWVNGGKSFGFSTANLIRKYGANWETGGWQNAEQRLKTWGFSGLGKWSGVTSPQAGPVQLPVQPVIQRAGVPTIGRMPDIFDEAVRAKFRSLLEGRIVPHINNPYIIGWSVGNEHNEIVLPSDIKAMLAKDATTPAKRALTDYALDHIYNGDVAAMATAWQITGATTREALEAATGQAPAADIETLRRYFADQYYGYIYNTIREIDPNHLYFGFWVGLGWWENDEDWRLIAKHADVIGYDAYRYNFSDNKYAALIKETDKPVMCGEFSYPSWYGGQRGGGVYGTSTPDDATSGQLYARWVSDAARDPYNVGMHWFQYRDQPISGRGQSDRPLALAQDEHYAFGLVDITDRPKWDMIGPMRAANLSAVQTRVQASPAAK